MTVLAGNAELIALCGAMLAIALLFSAMVPLPSAFVAVAPATDAPLVSIAKRSRSGFSRPHIAHAAETVPVHPILELQFFSTTRRVATSTRCARLFLQRRPDDFS